MTASVDRTSADRSTARLRRSRRPTRPTEPAPVADGAIVASFRGCGFAEAWVAAVAGTSYVRMTDEELLDCLRELAGRLAEVMLAEPFTANPAYQIGLELVAADLTAPEALG